MVSHCKKTVIMSGKKFIFVDEVGIRSYPILNEDIVDAVKIMIATIHDNLPEREFNLVCTGTSGLYIATIMKVLDPETFNIVCLRKDGVSAHSGAIIDKNSKSKRPYMFVDDFIAEGSTLKWCERKLIEHREKNIKYAMLMGECGGGPECTRDKKGVMKSGVKTFIIGKDW